MKKGFTLIEIMIVIVIIAILAAIAIPAFAKMKDRAAIRSAILSIQSLRKALITYTSIDSSDWVPTTYIELHGLMSLSSQKIVFDIDKLKGTITELGYEGGIAGGFTIVAVAKDRNKTRVWLNDYEVDGKDSNQGTVPTVTGGLNRL